MQFHGNMIHDLIVETNPGSNAVCPGEKAVVIAFTPSQPSSPEVECQTGYKDQIELTAGAVGVCRGFQNSERPVHERIPAAHQVEDQFIAKHAGQGDLLVLRPGSKGIGLAVQSGKRGDRPG